jgi:ABC-2 type transport system ATP-binding protein
MPTSLLADGPAIEFADVHKRLGKTKAVDGLSFKVRRGEVVALLGPNGAGKTTAVDLLLGLKTPDRGSIRLLGADPTDKRIRKLVGSTPQEISFPATLRVEEIVDFVRVHYPEASATSELLECFGLESLARRQAGGLSGGEKRRLAMALAFAGNPQLVVLDEPSTGLDAMVRRELWRHIKRFAQAEGTVMLTTHYLEEAEALSTSILLMDRGKLVASGKPDDIKGRIGLKRVHFRSHDSFCPEEWSGVVKATRSNATVTLYTPDSDRVVRELVRREVQFTNLAIEPVTLEYAFEMLTGVKG